MTVGLHNLGDSSLFCRFSHAAWVGVLQLARDNGWEPAGTALPRRDLPTGSATLRRATGYKINHGQIVSARDAQNMADALEKALALGQRDLPCQGTLFGGHYGRHRILKFIALCREGPFQIW